MSTSTHSQDTAAHIGLPWSVAKPALVAYRSIGIGVFGAFMRFVGMPLEKIALYMNSSQVDNNSNKMSPLKQAVRLTFTDGHWLAPYRVVGPASLTAWFLQYSVMGVAFQFVDQTLSAILQVRPVYYGHELMEPPLPKSSSSSQPADHQAKTVVKTILSPILAASMESIVSNRAEVQRYFGRESFAQMEQQLYFTHNTIPNRNHPPPPWSLVVRRVAGPCFVPSVARNVIMCQTSFLLTPITYKLYFPQERKSKSTLFWYGLSLNICVGNVLAITQQALWGRSLDTLAESLSLRAAPNPSTTVSSSSSSTMRFYHQVIRDGLHKEGVAAFFTLPKWFSRVLMNAPAQGTLPWFYNEILPRGEATWLRAVQSTMISTTVLGGSISISSSSSSRSTVPNHPNECKDIETSISSPTIPHATFTHDAAMAQPWMGSLPTAHPEIYEEEIDEEASVEGQQDVARK